MHACPNMRARGEGAARAAIRGELTLTAPAASKRVVAATGSPRLLGGRGRGRCSLQPRAAGALCTLRRRAAGRAVAAPRLMLHRHTGFESATASR